MVLIINGVEKYFNNGVTIESVIDILRISEDKEIVFEFENKERPVIFRKEDYIYLVLPMRI